MEIFHTTDMRDKVGPRKRSIIGGVWGELPPSNTLLIASTISLSLTGHWNSYVLCFIQLEVLVRNSLSLIGSVKIKLVFFSPEQTENACRNTHQRSIEKYNTKKQGTFMVPSSLSTSRTVRALDWALSIFSFSLNHTIRFSLSDVYSCQSFSESSNCCWLPVTRFVIITHCLVTLSSSLVALLPKFPGASSIIRWPVEQKLLYSGLWAWISFWHI